MVAKTDQKARLLDLTTSVLELVRDGKRDSGAVCDVLQLIKDKPNFVQELFPEKSSPAPKVAGQRTGFRSLIRDWQKFYHKYFPNLKVDLSNLQIPEKQEGLDRLIIVPQGLTPNLVYAVMSSHFQCWKAWDNLDSIKSDRDSTQTYAIWVRNRQEANTELKNLSANNIKEMGLKTETLLERLLHGFKFWDETHAHLDVHNITLCAGSRDSCGDVPDVGWGGGEVRVGWSLPTLASVNLRARLAV